jgi:hypothetical protein
MTSLPPPHLHDVCCPACGHVIGQGGAFNAARVGWDHFVDWVVLKGVSIGRNSELLAEKFFGSVCDKCKANDRRRAVRNVTPLDIDLSTKLGE